MKHYEETLSKIAPVYYKFINYREYFYEKRQYIDSYLVKANMHVFSSIEIEDTYLEYYLSASRNVYVASKMLSSKEIKYAKIDLFRFDLRGDVGFEGYTYGFIDFIVTLILNDFQLLGRKYLLDVHETNFTPYDLFILLVGKDMYETLKDNVK